MMITSARPAAIITGASSGLGAATARAFARAGIDVAVSARRHELLLQLAADLNGAAGGRALAVAADVTSDAAMRTLASRALAAFGRLDILVCSAGIGYQGSLDETPSEVLRRLLDVNVIGTLNAARAVLPYFETQHAGHLIVISSIVARRGIPGYAAYSAAKAAQAGLAEALRAELRSGGIAVTTVFPVSAATGFQDTMRREFGVESQGSGPTQSADAIARAILRATRTRAPEVYPLRRARLLAWLTTLAPALSDRVARRFTRSRVVAAAPARDRRRTPGQP
jgi:short-subunit dehydrogenase